MHNGHNSGKGANKNRNQMKTYRSISDILRNDNRRNLLSDLIPVDRA